MTGNLNQTDWVIHFEGLQKLSWASHRKGVLIKKKFWTISSKAVWVWALSKIAKFPCKKLLRKKELLWCCVHCTADGKERKQNKYVPAAQNVIHIQWRRGVYYLLKVWVCKVSAHPDSEHPENVTDTLPPASSVCVCVNVKLESQQCGKK